MTTKLNPSIYLTRDGYREEMWRGIHSIRHTDYQQDEPPLIKVFIASQHNQRETYKKRGVRQAWV